MRLTTALVGVAAIFGSAEAGAQQTAAQPAEKATATFRVTGLSCNICAGAVERAAKGLTGVNAATVSQPKGVAEITFDPSKTSPEEIARLLTKQSGFKTEWKKSSKK